MQYRPGLKGTDMIFKFHFKKLKKKKKDATQSSGAHATVMRID